MTEKRDLEETSHPPNHTCPRCGDPVVGVTTKGPTEHVLDPCGCRVSSVPTRRRQ